MSRGISTPKHKGNVNTTAELYPKLEASENNIEAKLHSNAEINVQIQNGQQGLSAYELWLLEGNEGTVEDFLESLKAEKYEHPETHPASMIEETEDKQFISTTDKLKLSGFVHDQILPSKVWIVKHTLDKYPSVSVVDSGNNLVMGSVEYLSKNELKISFSFEFSGKAYLN